MMTMIVRRSIIWRITGLIRRSRRERWEPHALRLLRKCMAKEAQADLRATKTRTMSVVHLRAPKQLFPNLKLLPLNPRLSPQPNPQEQEKLSSSELRSYQHQKHHLSLQNCL
jgi:hypothetical protein